MGEEIQLRNGVRQHQILPTFEILEKLSPKFCGKRKKNDK